MISESKSEWTWASAPIYQTFAADPLHKSGTVRTSSRFEKLPLVGFLFQSLPIPTNRMLAGYSHIRVEGQLNVTPNLHSSKPLGICGKQNGVSRRNHYSLKYRKSTPPRTFPAFKPSPFPKCQRSLQFLLYESCLSTKARMACPKSDNCTGGSSTSGGRMVNPFFSRR